MSDYEFNLVIVIVNFRTPDLVTQCLASLLSELDGMNARVIIVDNCSQDDASIPTIKNWISRYDLKKIVQLVEASTNGGFSAGNNLGIRALDAQYYLLLNSDTIVRPGALRTLIEAAESQPEAGIISPRLEWRDGVAQESCFQYPSPISEFIGAARTGPITAMLKKFVVPQCVSDEVRRPQWTSFACVLLRRIMLEKIGLMDEGFFLYFEDVELCYRARAAGWDIVHYPKAKVVHLRGGSSTVKQRTKERKRLPRYYYASRTRYFYLVYGRLGLTLANVLWLLGRCISKCREFIERRERGIPERQWLDIWTNWFDPVTLESKRN